MHKELISNRDDIFTVAHFLSPAECHELIARTEQRGYGDAPVNGAFGPVIRKEVRNNDRVMFDDVTLASALWQKAQPFVPERRGQWRAVGLNERLRFYRYQFGQQFYWHFDGRFARSPHEESALTFMVYLNEGFGGGATEFNLKVSGGVFDTDPVVRVTPQMGMLLVFTHNVLHQGAMVTEGTKYVLRSDVMYRWAGQ